MIGRPNSFATQVRLAAKSLQEQHGQFTSADLKHVVDWGDRSKNAVQAVIWDLRRFGEITAVERGVYRFVDKDSEPLKREIMWRFLRMQRSLTADDLSVAAGVSRKWAGEFLSGLDKLGIVRRHPNGIYQIIKDQLDVPVNDAKAKKLKEARERKKARLALALEKATIACSEAIRFLKDEEADPQ
ncbi:MAG: hypothetical protein AB9866_11060 [Syntrophobacteraceae bacterium]